MTTDHYPCVGVSHSSQIEAEQARHDNYDGKPRGLWRCVDGHFHEGVSS